MSRLISMSFNTRHLLIIVINIGGVSFFFRITDFGRQQNGSQFTFVGTELIRRS